MVCPEGEEAETFLVEDVAYTGPGTIINSGDWNGLNIEEAKKVAIKEIEAISAGSKKVTFRLRDWGYHVSDIGDAQYQ